MSPARAWALVAAALGGQRAPAWEGAAPRSARVAPRLGSGSPIVNLSALGRSADS